MMKSFAKSFCFVTALAIVVFVLVFLYQNNGEKMHPYSHKGKMLFSNVLK
jgi:low affinity Fe/Cu permease